MIRAGKLRKRVTIQQPVENHTDGELTTTWDDVATVYAGVEPLNSRELFQAQQTRAETTHRVTLRYRPDLTVKANYRVLLGTRELYLTGPPRNIDELGEHWEFLCREAE